MKQQDTDKASRRPNRTAILVVILCAISLTFALPYTPKAIEREAQPNSTIHIKNESLLFDDGSDVFFSLNEATETVYWTIERHDNKIVETGNTTRSTILAREYLDPGYYTLTLRSGSNAPTTISFGVTGAKPKPDQFYGVQTLTAHTAGSYRQDYSRILPMLSDLGFSVRRDSTYWSEYERTKGEYSSSSIDRELAKIDNKTGTSLLWTAGRQNRLYGNSSFPSTPAEIHGYANYIDAVLLDFPQITHVEILNEFNSTSVNTVGCGPSPRCYLDILRTVYPQIKKRHPKVEIIAGATSGVATKWSEELLRIGGGEYMDAYSIHPYATTPDSMVTHAKQLRQEILVATGRPKPVYFSEFGCSILPEKGRGGRVADERLQAICLIYAFNAAREGGVKGLSYYNAINYGPIEHEYNFGLFYDIEERSHASAYQPKQSALAFYLMRKKLEHYSYSHREILLDTDDARVTSYVYQKKNGDTLQVIWRSDQSIYFDSEKPDESGRSVRISTNNRAYTYVDSFMNDNLGAYVGRDQITREVSLEPIYVESTNTPRS